MIVMMMMMMMMTMLMTNREKIQLQFPQLAKG